jgi:hypothetical protein
VVKAEAVLLLQAAARGRSARKAWAAVRAAVLLLQTAARGRSARDPLGLAPHSQ